MNTATDRWDVRVHPDVVDLLESWRGRAWWWRITREQAAELVALLCRSYKIERPGIVPLNDSVRRAVKIPRRTGGMILRLYGLYFPDGRLIALHGRNHVKTVVHEFYHHLDTMTDGQYDSDDKRGGESSLAWKFAERWWARYLELR